MNKITFPLKLRMQGLKVGHLRAAPAKKTSVAVAHKTMEEIWYVLSGQGDRQQFAAPFTDVTAIWQQLIKAMPGTRRSGTEPDR